MSGDKKTLKSAYLKAAERIGEVGKGGFVWCKFPYNQDYPAFPGKKLRPAYIHDVMRDAEGLIDGLHVIYCSSANVGLRMNDTFDLRLIGNLIIPAERKEKKKFSKDDYRFFKVLGGYIHLGHQAIIPLTEDFFPKGADLIGKRTLPEILRHYLELRTEKLPERIVLSQAYERALFIRNYQRRHPGKPLQIWEPDPEKRFLRISNPPIPRWIAG